MPADAQDIARVALTFEWSEDAAHPLSGEHLPPADALAQLFYALNILYVETVRPGPERGISAAPSSRLHGIPAQWVRIATRLMVRSETPGSEWPDALLAPRVAQAETLRLESVVMASPIELILAVPASAAMGAGAWSVLRFVNAIEKAWNAPGRVALERARIERDLVQAQFETEQVTRRYMGLTQDGFRLVGGSADVPDGWDGPAPVGQPG